MLCGEWRVVGSGPAHLRGHESVRWVDCAHPVLNRAANKLVSQEQEPNSTERSKANLDCADQTPTQLPAPTPHQVAAAMGARRGGGAIVQAILAGTNPQNDAKQPSTAATKPPAEASAPASCHERRVTRGHPPPRHEHRTQVALAPPARRVR